MIAASEVLASAATGSSCSKFDISGPLPPLAGRIQSGSARWSPTEEIGWSRTQEIRWSSTQETGWSPTEEIVQRNTLIFDDVLAALEAGRCPLVLTERRDHLEVLRVRFEKFAKNVVVLRGGMGSRERRVAEEA